MSRHVEITEADLDNAWKLLKTKQPLEEMMKCPVKKRVVYAVAKGLHRRQAHFHDRWYLQCPSDCFDYKKAQAND